MDIPLQPAAFEEVFQNHFPPVSLCLGIMSEHADKISGIVADTVCLFAYSPDG